MHTMIRISFSTQSEIQLKNMKPGENKNSYTKIKYNTKKKTKIASQFGIFAA